MGKNQWKKRDKKQTNKLKEEETTSRAWPEEKKCCLVGFAYVFISLCGKLKWVECAFKKEMFLLLRTYSYPCTTGLKPLYSRIVILLAQQSWIKLCIHRMKDQKTSLEIVGLCIEIRIQLQMALIPLWLSWLRHMDFCMTKAASLIYFLPKLLKN